MFLFLCFLCVCAAFQNSSVRKNVVVHEIGRAFRVRQDDTRRGGTGAQVEGQIRLSSGIHHERVHRAEEAVRHHESGRQSGLEGLRCGHPQRLSIKVGGII